MRGKIDRTTNDGDGAIYFVLRGQNYHNMGSMMPESDSTPKFAQIYIYDTQNESKNQYNASNASQSLNESLVKTVPTTYVRQFPPTLCFAITINKSQGQSSSNVGNYLSNLFFTQVTSKKRFKILILDEEDCVSTKTTNVVYRGVFQNV
ncbi:AT hook motif protein, putative [Medicago truncatula]|uniref:AT hook motif protein, putative n=1 Tax=Medicago truncatula TaxID=3880 RepID=G7KFZ1_MEDTR|nr:AT hook motif protein, putative [Medicago truncatula]